MVRTGVLLAIVAAGLIGQAGCRLPQPPGGVGGEPRPGLLIGPEAAGAASQVELPDKDAARLCLRTAAEFEKSGQVEEAIGLYQKARAADPSLTAQASRRLAVLYDRAAEFGKAMEEYEALLKAHPKDADLLNDVGYSHYCRGDWANAESYLGRAVKADPKHKRAAVNLGMALAQQGRWDEALQAFTKVVRPAEAHCNLAFALATQGRTEEAKQHYQRELELDPGMKLAREVLARLENPPPPGPKKEPGGGKKGYPDPVEAAAKVPSFAQLEARLKANGTLPADPSGPEPTGMLYPTGAK